MFKSSFTFLHSLPAWLIWLSEGFFDHAQIKIYKPLFISWIYFCMPKTNLIQQFLLEI